MYSKSKRTLPACLPISPYFTEHMIALTERWSKNNNKNTILRTLRLLLPSLFPHFLLYFCESEEQLGKTESRTVKQKKQQQQKAAVFSQNNTITLWKCIWIWIEEKSISQSGIVVSLLLYCCCFAIFFFISIFFLFWIVSTCTQSKAYIYNTRKAKHCFHFSIRSMLLFRYFQLGLNLQKEQWW